MERIIDLSLRHKDRLMAGQPWLMKIIILLKLKFFSLFSRNPFNPSTGTANLTAREQCEVWFAASLFFALRFQNLFGGAEPPPAGAERVRRSLRGANAPSPTLFYFSPIIHLGRSDFSRCNFIQQIPHHCTLYLAPPWFNSSVRPPLQALCSPLIEPIIPPRGTEAAPLPQMTPSYAACRLYLNKAIKSPRQMKIFNYTNV